MFERSPFVWLIYGLLRSEMNNFLKGLSKIAMYSFLLSQCSLNFNALKIHEKILFHGQGDKIHVVTRPRDFDIWKQRLQ